MADTAPKERQISPRPSTQLPSVTLLFIYINSALFSFIWRALCQPHKQKIMQIILTKHPKT